MHNKMGWMGAQRFARPHVRVWRVEARGVPDVKAVVWKAVRGRNHRIERRAFVHTRNRVRSSRSSCPVAVTACTSLLPQWGALLHFGLNGVTPVGVAQTHNENIIMQRQVNKVTSSLAM